MFGYIKPLKDELKVREFEQFKACYCALCHTLKKQYGVFSRNILNYDFTFLAMLLWDESEAPAYKCARCVASPFIKKTYCASSHALEICAGYSVILAWWKLRDSVADESFLKSLRDRVLSLMLRRAYKKASKNYTAFENTVRLSLSALKTLEQSGSDSLDACANQFAVITEALAIDAADGSQRRPLEQLLYHTGRFIYIIDACDDLEEDTKAGSFNPVANRFKIKTGKLTNADKETIRATLIHSCNLIGTAYELLPQNAWTSIIRNIIYLGMPEACARVLDGTWNFYRVTRLNKGNGQTL
jgi:hypothetical protein